MHLYTLLKYAIKMRIFPARLSEIKLCESWTSIVKCMLKQNKSKHRFYPRVIASPTQDVILRQRERRWRCRKRRMHVHSQAVPGRGLSGWGTVARSAEDELLVCGAPPGRLDLPLGQKELTQYQSLIRPWMKEEQTDSTQWDLGPTPYISCGLF